MEREEAKHILQLCRPGNDEDRLDPLIAKAIGLCDDDDELRTWFEEQQAIDARIGVALGTIEPLPNFKASTLIGMRAHRSQAELTSGDEAKQATSEQNTHFPRPATSQWLKPWMGIAALLAVLIAIVAVPRTIKNSPQFATNDTAATAEAVPDFIQFLAGQISDLKSWNFDKKGKQASQLQSFLASTGMPNPAHIPGTLNALPTIGCVTFDFDGTKLSMICFKQGDNVYHLITANKADFSQAILARPESYEYRGQAFKVWAEAEQILILSVEGTKADIPEFI